MFNIFEPDKFHAQFRALGSMNLFHMLKMMAKKIFTPFIHFSIWTYESVSEELMYQAQEFPQITPMEIDILFQLVALRHQTG